MKICITGPITGFSGFGIAVRNFIKALYFASKHQDVEFTARNLQYDKADAGNEYKPDDWLNTLLHNDLNNVDLLIQATTCNVEAVPKAGVCNALYTFFELDRIPAHWANKANEFDFIIVPCRFNVEVLVRCGVTKPILVIAPPCDIDNYNGQEPAFDIPNSKDRTIFYNICQLSAKKGIDCLLRAYWAAFADRPDEVLLVLKTYVGMADRQNDKDIVKNFIGQVKAQCNIPLEKLPPVLPIVKVLGESEVHGLHKAGHAYVNSSRGEGWCLPAFDALGFGKTLITNGYGGMADYVSEDNSLLYGGTISHVFNSPHPEPYLHIGVARWFEPSTAQLADTMLAYHLLRKGAQENKLDDASKQSWQKILDMQQKGIELTQKCDYRHSGPIILSHLLAALTKFKQTGKIAFTQEQS